MNYTEKSRSPINIKVNVFSPRSWTMRAHKLNCLPIWNVIPNFEALFVLFCPFLFYLFCFVRSFCFVRFSVLSVLFCAMARTTYVSWLPNNL